MTDPEVIMSTALANTRLIAQEKALYGPELYQKAQQQLKSPKMQAHRQRHGFNESAKKD